MSNESNVEDETTISNESGVEDEKTKALTPITTATFESQHQTHEMRKNPMTVFTYALQSNKIRCI